MIQHPIKPNTIIVTNDRGITRSLADQALDDCTIHDNADEANASIDMNDYSHFIFDSRTPDVLVMLSHLSEMIEFDLLFEATDIRIIGDNQDVIEDIKCNHVEIFENLDVTVSFE